ncbi:MAG: TetR/AcrR family transcriptional regulator [Candidatus Aminicenantes bacterium]|nr:TetR/AcrR family transcriptional regulator [Candidatus Aminicenantes bacterium]NTV80200.1 TetR/AcrR family transcriptional regulator [Candidatus Aminicenantes bacterium]
MRTSDVRRERELRRREGYRETVLHAAERVILRKGFSALTMDDVAREAQLSKATIYKYVAGKGVLLFEIMGHNFDDIRDRVAGIVDGPGTAGEKLGQVVRIVLESGEEMKQVNRVLWMDKSVLKLMRVFAPLPGKAGAAPPADRKVMAMLRQKRQMLVDLGARIFEEGVASGEFRPMDTRAAADFLESVLQGYMHTRFWQGDAPLPPAAAESLTRFIIDGIRNPERSGKEN